jgi:hypothetical protein
MPKDPQLISREMVQNILVIIRMGEQKFLQQRQLLLVTRDRLRWTI